MAKKKSTKTRLFENDLTITGKHATHLKFLVNDAMLFDDYIDVYMNAAVFGYLYSKRDTRDTESKDRARIYSDAFSTHRSECIMLYRLIILLDEQDIALEERLNRAFRYDSNAAKEEEVKKCRTNAEKLSKKALWSNFIKYYEQAYDFALRKAEARKQM